MNSLKPENPIFLWSTRAADHKMDMLKVVTLIQQHMTSGLIFLFYLNKFSFIVHAKCFSPAFFMNY